jgi:hypothetical protein
VRCVRADLVSPVELRRYSWVLLPHKQRAAVAGWLLDERTHTFTVVANDGTPQVRARWEGATACGAGGDRHAAFCALVGGGGALCWKPAMG